LTSLVLRLTVFLVNLSRTTDLSCWASAPDYLQMPFLRVGFNLRNHGRIAKLDGIIGHS